MAQIEAMQAIYDRNKKAFEAYKRRVELNLKRLSEKDIITLNELRVALERNPIRPYGDIVGYKNLFSNDGDP